MHMHEESRREAGARRRQEQDFRWEIGLKVYGIEVRRWATISQCAPCGGIEEHGRTVAGVGQNRNDHVGAAGELVVVVLAVIAGAGDGRLRCLQPVQLAVCTVRVRLHPLHFNDTDV